MIYPLSLSMQTPETANPKHPPMPKRPRPQPAERHVGTSETDRTIAAIRSLIPDADLSQMREAIAAHPQAQAEAIARLGAMISDPDDAFPARAERIRTLLSQGFSPITVLHSITTGEVPIMY